MYGGAVGGAKTIGLFLFLAQGIDLPDYTGYFFRRTWAECHGGNDSPLAKAFKIYQPLGGKWTGGEHKTWLFPSGAKIVFGHLEDATAHLRYQGPSAHRLAFDELTHFSEDQYLWMVAYRMRKVKGYPISCGVRSSCNPGGPGHEWVKQRFITPDAIQTLGTLDPRAPCPPGLIFWPTPDRAFVPARLADNPHLDIDDYEKRMSMQSKSPVLRARMMNGDWSVRENGIIKAEWLRYYRMRGEIICRLDRDGKEFGHYDCQFLPTFATVDTAGTSEEKARERRGKPPSWSVIGVWQNVPPRYGKGLLLRDVWRKRVEFPDLLNGFREVHAKWHPRWHVENKHVGPAAVQILRRELGNMSLIELGTKDKLERSTPLQNMLERGEIYLPENENSWRPELEAEWLGWTGDPDEPADQVDISSYAAMLEGPAQAAWGGVVKSR